MGDKNVVVFYGNVGWFGWFVEGRDENVFDDEVFEMYFVSVVLFCCGLFFML